MKNISKVNLEMPPKKLYNLNEIFLNNAFDKVSGEGLHLKD